jgi:hypothetical protein
LLCACLLACLQRASRLLLAHAVRPCRAFWHWPLPGLGPSPGFQRTNKHPTKGHGAPPAARWTTPGLWPLLAPGGGEAGAVSGHRRSSLFSYHNPPKLPQPQALASPRTCHPHPHPAPRPAPPPPPHLPAPLPPSRPQRPLPLPPPPSHITNPPPAPPPNPQPTTSPQQKKVLRSRPSVSYFLTDRSRIAPQTKS